MEKYTFETDEFLRNKILPKIGQKEYTEDNIGEIVDYLFREIEGPLCDAEEAGEQLSAEEKDMLRLATKAITEITTRPDWK